MERPWHLDRNRLAWGVVGLVLLGLLFVVVRPFVGTFSVAIFLYYATRPLYERVNDRVSHPNAAATITLLAVVLPGILIVGYAVVVGVQNASQFLQTANLQQYQSLIEPYTSVTSDLSSPGKLFSEVQSAIPTSSAGIPALLTSATAALGTVFSVLLRLFLVLAFTFYFLRDDQKLSGWFYGVFAGGRNPDGADQTVVEEFGESVDNDLETVYLGNLLNVFAIAIIALAANHLLNVVAPSSAGIPAPTLLALLTGIASLVPAVGMKIVYFPVTALLLGVSLASGGPLWFPVAYFVVTFVVVDTVPDFAVRAYLSGRSLHMGLVMFSYILGSVVFGWYGIFVGPLLLVLGLHFGKTVLPYVVRGQRE